MQNESGLIKVLSFDLDGTLLKTDKTIDQNTINWINENESIFELFIFASGRKYDQIVPYIRLFNEKVQNKIYVISSGGEFIFNPDEMKIWSAESIEVDDAIKICRCIKSKYPKTGCLIVTENCDYAVYEEMDLSLKIKNISYKLRGINNFRNIDIKNSKVIKDSIEKIILQTRKDDAIRSSLVNMSDYSVNLIEDKQVDVRLRIVNKSAAIQKLLVQRNLSKENIIVFGDDENDLDVFEMFPNTVAMGNASNSIKSFAKNITESNDSKGIVKFLSGYFKGEQL